MIFGFNTDIKHEDTVYHVQSEAREAEHLLQTQVFVRGRCIGKFARSYSEHLQQPGFSDDSMHELLKVQHRNALDAIREGNIEELLNQPSLSTPESGEEPQPSLPARLNLELLGSATLGTNGDFLLRIRLTDAGAGVSGAKLLSKVTSDAHEHAAYFQTSTGEDGIGELQIACASSSVLTVLVQSSHNGRTATRKLILRSTK